MNDPLLKVDDLKVHFPIKKGILSKTVGYVYAVDGISFENEVYSSVFCPSFRDLYCG